MLVLSEYKPNDMIGVCNQLTYDELIYYEKYCHLRTFKDIDKVIAIGMVTPNGEIGLLITDIPRKYIKKFYTLLTIFATEGFNFSDKDKLYTGIKPDSKYTRWIKYLDFSQADSNNPAHEERGWTTYELPLRRWLQ